MTDIQTRTQPARQIRFGPIDVAYDGTVLEPRPWTVAQAAWAIEVLEHGPAGPVLELCAGAGQIGLVVATLSGRPLVQVDASPAACAFARRNAGEAGVVCDVRAGDLAETVGDDERFALVLADPPYIPTGRVAEHPADPPAAIDGGDDGLAVARRCVGVAARHLLPGGSLVVQLGSEAQAEALAAEALAQGFASPAVRVERSDRVLLLLRRAG